MNAGAAPWMPAHESQAWVLLAQLFDYPDVRLVERLRNGEFQEGLEQSIGMIAPRLLQDFPVTGRDEVPGLQALAAEYSRLFYFGERDTPLCSLHEGEHRGHRMEVMEKVLRYYTHFGLQIATTPNEMPDHLVSELEFLHFLSFQEERYRRHGMDGEAFRRARIDFLCAHPKAWVRDFCERIADTTRLPFYRDCARLLAGFLGAALAAHGIVA